MNFARLLKNFPSIIQWQFIQKHEKSYTLKVNADDNIETAAIMGELKMILGEDAKIDLERVKEIPVLASGKRKPVICEWKKL